MTDNAKMDIAETPSERSSRPGESENGRSATSDVRSGVSMSSWQRRMETLETVGQEQPTERRMQERRQVHFEYADSHAEVAPVPDESDPEVDRLRDEARRVARADAESGVPGPNTEGPTESELELKNRCVTVFERWHSRERRKLSEEIGDHEERIADTLGKAEMGVDRFHRMINELIRLKARFAIRRKEVTQQLSSEGEERERGIATHVYISALVFLGLVEFFANAPVFGSLLPRDPLTETQIGLLSETATGWLAGFQRVGAHIIFRPDAALLAAGVITFLCVLAHFFGHSLRDLVMQGEREERRQTVHSRSKRENVVPIVLASTGLILTLGVLYEARVQLGEVGQERYATDMAQVDELRRQAGWLRVDGEILQANQLTNRAEDMEGAATELREYSASMARMNFPIMLLNLTLVLCAVSAAYFHQKDAIRQQFKETPFEDDRTIFVERGEECARETSQLLSDVVKDLRALKTLAVHGLVDESRAMLHQLESVLATYRAENSRARGMDSQSIMAFATPIRLEVGLEEAETLSLRDPDDYERERAEVASRLRELRSQFNQEATAAW